MGHSPAQANTSAEFHGYLVRLAANSQRDNWFLTDTVYVSIVNSGDHPINWDPPPGTAAVAQGHDYMLLRLDKDFFVETEQR